MIIFCHFFTHFLSIEVHFSEKLDFAIKNHCFLMFSDVNFDQKVVIFGVILGSF